MIDFILIANKRTGSTFLQEAISSHPEAFCFDEMFLVRSKSTVKRQGTLIYTQKRNKELEKFDGLRDKDGNVQEYTIKEYLEWLSDKHKNKKTGVRVVYPQLDHWRELCGLVLTDNIPLIHLIRQNYFEQAMSYHTRTQSKNHIRKRKIDIDQLIWRINKIEQDTKFYRNFFKGNRYYVEVYYEKLFGKTTGKENGIKKRGSFNIESNQLTFISPYYKKRLCDFLKVRTKDLYSNVTKRTSWNVWDYIENEKQVKEALEKENIKYEFGKE